MTAGDRNGNAVPGTLVERDITHPFEYDFYLCSHSAIQGTARPVHYQVILDEAQVPVNDFQRMVYQHCYQYMRSTTPVSLCKFYKPPWSLFFLLISARSCCVLRTSCFQPCSCTWGPWSQWRTSWWRKVPRKAIRGSSQESHYWWKTRCSKQWHWFKHRFWRRATSSLGNYQWATESWFGRSHQDSHEHVVHLSISPYSTRYHHDLRHLSLVLAIFTILFCFITYFLILGSLIPRFSNLSLHISCYRNWFMGDLGIGLVSSLLRTLASSLILFHGSGSKLSSFSLT